MPDATPLADQQLLQREVDASAARLSTFTETLPENDRTLLELLCVQALPVEAVAAARKIDKGTLYVRKTRLIQKLRDWAEKNE